MIEPIFYALFGIFVGSTFVSNVLICSYLGLISKSFGRMNDQEIKDLRQRLSWYEDESLKEDPTDE